jgi:DNA-binding MarR family transcriptional regulator
MTAADVRNIERLEQLRGLLFAINPFLALNGRMPLRCVQAFLAVAVYPGESVSGYAKRCRLSVSTMSRNLLDIGPRNRNFGDGLGLLQSRDNPDNRRERIYALTPAGLALLNKVLSALR